MLLGELSAHEIGEKGKRTAALEGAEARACSCPPLSQTDDVQNAVFLPGDNLSQSRRSYKDCLPQQKRGLANQYGNIGGESQTCVSCMLPGAGRTEPELGRLLLLDSTGTSAASCSALRVATSLSKYACHKTHHRNYSRHAKQRERTRAPRLVIRPRKNRQMRTIIQKHVEGDLCPPQSKQETASTHRHHPRPSLKNWCPITKLTSVCGAVTPPNSKLTTSFSAKDLSKSERGQSQVVATALKCTALGMPLGTLLAVRTLRWEGQPSDYLQTGSAKLSCSILNSVMFVASCEPPVQKRDICAQAKPSIAGSRCPWPQWSYESRDYKNLSRRGPQTISGQRCKFSSGVRGRMNSI